LSLFPDPVLVDGSPGSSEGSSPRRAALFTRAAMLLSIEAAIDGCVKVLGGTVAANLTVF
jgi:hypothetical protein